MLQMVGDDAVSNSYMHILSHHPVNCPWHSDLTFRTKKRRGKMTITIPERALAPATDEVPILQFPHRPALVSCASDDRVFGLCPMLSCLPSSPSVLDGPQPAPHFGGCGQHLGV
jgi:hypothetical protein